ncbi:MAG: NADH-quinone oxidoreductase subunit M [Acidimicrobiales bacterium]
MLATAEAPVGAAGFPILTVLTLLPLATAIVVALLPRRRTEAIKAVAVGGALIAGILAAYLTYQFATGTAAFQFQSQHTYIQSFGISWHLGVDGISIFLVLLCGFLFPLAMVGPTIHHDTKSYLAWLLVLETGCIGSFLSLDLFLFFLFFEITLVPMYFIIAGWGYANRAYASTKFFLYTLTGSAVMLVGMLALALLHAQANGGTVTFDLLALTQGNPIGGTAATLIFLSFVLAFGIKVPLFPIHTWLPDAHTEAPTGGSVILAGVLLKLGTYGLLRFGIFLFPKQARDLAPLLLVLAVIGMIYGALVATVQKDLKRLVAYSSVAHLGFIVLGLFALTTQGLSGGVVQMVNHGLSTGALFLLVGMIYERRHTRQIAELHGLQKVAPWLATIFTVVMLSSVGVPGLNGFVGEFLILIGTFVTHRWYAVVGAVGVILAALYLLWAYQRVFHGEPTGDNATMTDMTWRERWVMLPLLAAIVFLGVYPKPMLTRIQPSVDAVLAHVHDVTGYRQPDVVRGLPGASPTAAVPAAASGGSK